MSECLSEKMNRESVVARFLCSSSWPVILADHMHGMPGLECSLDSCSFATYFYSRMYVPGYRH